ncbi:MAG: SLC13 family permease [Acidobacteria bacterium]|nr:SLC13 family permease [Acidobacteriota bacterium]
MLTFFGVVAIATLLLLVLSRATSALIALILVPLVAGVLAGLGADVGAHALVGIQGVAGTAAMLGFAVLYFGLMNDAGLFRPLVEGVLRVSGSDPRRVVVGTAVVAMVTHLDGAGASTFLITIPALLPVYDRLRIDRVVLATTVALAAGTMNILPWAGPTLRAATSLQVEVLTLFRPLLPSVGAGLLGVLGVAV